MYPRPVRANFGFGTLGRLRGGVLNLGRRSLQRKRRVRVERQDFRHAEPRLVYFEIRAELQSRRDVLDRETHGFRRSREAAIAQRAPALLATARKQLGRRREIENLVTRRRLRAALRLRDGHMDSPNRLETAHHLNADHPNNASYVVIEQAKTKA